MIQLLKFHKRDSIDKLMFAHVNSLVTNMPITVDKALANFMKHYGLNDGDIKFDSLRVTYFRMRNEFNETLKTENNES